MKIELMSDAAAGQQRDTFRFDLYKIFLTLLSKKLKINSSKFYMIYITL